MGYLVLVGFTEGDDRAKVEYICNRIVKMRIFRDADGKLNDSLEDIGGEVMCVSNFTLYANPATGRSRCTTTRSKCLPACSARRLAVYSESICT